MVQDVDRMRDFPFTRKNPFLKGPYLTGDKTLRISNDIGNREENTKTIIRDNKIAKGDSLDLLCEILKNNLEIKLAGVVVFRYIYKQVQSNKKFNSKSFKIIINIYDCMTGCKYTSMQSVWNGLSELLQSDIIARGGQSGVYFLNPNFFLKSDALVITDNFKING